MHTIDDFADCNELHFENWHLFGIVNVKVDVFPLLKMYVMMKLEELALNILNHVTPL